MTKFFLLIALCIVAAICAEVATTGIDSEAQFKKFAAFQESFLKSAQAQAAAGISNLRTMGTNAASYGVYQIFNSATCSGTPAYAASTAIGVCMPLYGGSGSVIVTVSGSTATVTDYTDTACTQNPTQYIQAPLNSCSGGNFNGVSAGINVITQSGSAPSYSVNGVAYTTYDTTADCNAQAPGVYGFLWYPTGANGCVAATSSSSGSSSITCSGGNVNVNVYSQANCAGTAQGGSLASNYMCSTPTVSSLTLAQGYNYISCTTPPAAAASSTCFAGSESIMLESGATVPISDVRVGDKVLAYSSASQSTVFSDVVAVPHGQNNIKANFQHIAMESGADIKMTAEHSLPAGACSLASLPLARAADVQVGDCVQTTEGVSRVVSNNVVSDEGIYTIVTNADFVVVNGVVASPFAVNHAVANFMYGIHRMVYAVAPKMVAPLSGVMSNLAAYFTK